MDETYLFKKDRVADAIEDKALKESGDRHRQSMGEQERHSENISIVKKQTKFNLIIVKATIIVALSQVILIAGKASAGEYKNLMPFWYIFGGVVLLFMLFMTCSLIYSYFKKD